MGSQFSADYVNNSVPFPFDYKNFHSTKYDLIFIESNKKYKNHIALLNGNIYSIIFVYAHTCNASGNVRSEYMVQTAVYKQQQHGRCFWIKCEVCAKTKQKEQLIAKATQTFRQFFNYFELNNLFTYYLNYL